MDKLRVTSYNCDIISNSSYDTHFIRSQNDAVFLYELWLFKSELHIFSNIHDAFVMVCALLACFTTTHFDETASVNDMTKSLQIVIVLNFRTM